MHFHQVDVLVVAPLLDLMASVTVCGYKPPWRSIACIKSDLTMDEPGNLCKEVKSLFWAFAELLINAVVLPVQYWWRRLC